MNAWFKQHTASLQGKTIAVTGTTGGLGKELCRYLASLGADLILLDRNPEKSRAFQAELTERYCVSVKCMTVDLQDMNAVKEVTQALSLTTVDILIHNAGAYSIPRCTCDTGLDNVFQINFFSPYYMIRQLLPTLRARNGTVVVVGSIAHNYSKADFDDVDFSSRKQASKVYGNAKRYLMASLYELFKHETGVTLAVTHPGIAFTNITAHYPPWLFCIIRHPMKILFMKPKKACLSILYGVFAPCGYREWIGPWRFDVWGLPKKKRLRTITDNECKRIGEAADKLYQELCK